MSGHTPSSRWGTSFLSFRHAQHAKSIEQIVEQTKAKCKYCHRAIVTSTRFVNGWEHEDSQKPDEANRCFPLLIATPEDYEA